MWWVAARSDSVKKSNYDDRLPPCRRGIRSIASGSATLNSVHLTHAVKTVTHAAYETVERGNLGRAKDQGRPR